jgi:phosphoglycerate kinase
MNNYPKIQDIYFQAKRVFLRLDLNVPLAHTVEDTYEVSDDTRILAAIPTIQHIQKEGGKCIIASHLGRPEGKPNAKFSLDPVGRKLSEILKQDILLAEDCVGDGVISLSQQMKSKDILLLENLRFHKEEEENSFEFANQLFKFTDIYITDAFGTLHRAHASTSALPRLVEQRAIGFLIQKELEYLEPLRDNPEAPVALIMGGSKVSDKIALIEKFLTKVDKILIGGAMSFAFLKARGISIGKSLCDDKQVAIASKLLRSADARNIAVILPQDHVAVRNLEDDKSTITRTPEVPDDLMGVDIGPKTVEYFASELQNAKTIFWNGPMGVFEKEAFAKGTRQLAEVIAATSAKKIVGGGDSAAAIQEAGLADRFDFISTGGGATLEFLEGKELPGLLAVESFI